MKQKGENMVLVRPRLTDFYNISLTQEEVDFAIPFLDEDIPLYVDPFLLWKSPSMQDNSLHTAITNSFNNLGYLLEKGREKEAIDILIRGSECSEVGLGVSKTKRGARIGEKTAHNILSLFKEILLITFYNVLKLTLLIVPKLMDSLSKVKGKQPFASPRILQINLICFVFLKVKPNIISASKNVPISA